MVETNIVLTLLQTLSIMVGIGYYILNLQNNQKNQNISIRNQELTLESQQQALETRQAQLFMNTYQAYNTPEFLRALDTYANISYKDYDEYESKYRSDLETHVQIMKVYSYMEGLGVLVREGYIGIRLISLYISTDIFVTWEIIKPMAYEYRKRNDYPRYLIEFEYLYNTLIEYAEQHPEMQIKAPNVNTKL
jgi:hypothetical protein